MQEVQVYLPVGSVLRERYVIETLLGQGGFGAVYRVRDERVKGNLYALKEVIESQRKDLSRRERTRFQSEVDILKQLDHRALPRVYHIFVDDAHERAYMLMDYIDGPNLEVLRQQQTAKRFSLSQALRLMEPVVDAISYLHSQQPPIIHRDIKPANIIVPASNEAILVDFDIAKEFDPDSTTTAVRRCSPGYGAPEQYGQGTSTLTDIYGLGATLYTILSGQVPPDALQRMTMLGAKRRDPLVPLDQFVPHIPKRVVVAVQRAMSLHQTDRFSTVEQFWHEIDANATSLEIPALQALVSASLAQNASTVQKVGSEDVPITGIGGKLPVTPLPPITDLPTAQLSSVPASEKRRRLPLLLILLALIVCLGSVLGLWVGVWHAGSASALNPFGSPTLALRVTPVITLSPLSDPTVVSKPTGTSGKVLPTRVPTIASFPPTAVATPTSVSYPTATPIPTPRPTPTPTPIPYPTLAGTYHGTIVDTLPSPHLSAPMYLSSVTQNKGSLSGTFIVNAPLLGNGPFTGTVGTDKYIQFTVKGYNGNAPLFFWGFVQSNATLQGQYCSLDSTGHCSASVGGEGYWNVGPGS